MPDSLWSTPISSLAPAQGTPHILLFIIPIRFFDIPGQVRYAPGNTMQKPSPPDWKILAQSAPFRALIRAKKRFLVPACLFFILYYFSLLYLVGWHPELMKKPLLGPVNGAYLFALSQFFMAWGMAWVYMRKASGFDRAAASVIKDESSR